MYAKRYAPANWKSAALAVNIFDLKPWLDRVRSAPTDLDFYQICTEYVAQFQDGHSSFRTPSNLVADLGLFSDIYDGKAAAANRGMTAPLPSCAPALSNTFIAPRLTYAPLVGDDGQPVAYDKPLIVLADELSVSFGDIFPAMMQDNRRGPIVGVRTGGLGGSISTWQVGVYSESSASTTNTLVVRRDNVKAPDLPAAPYIENIGVLPDIDLDYMTRENLMTRGRPFMDKVTQIMLEEIRKPRAQ
ncbi:MAG: S41 family peptidase [Acidobacteria bacterium]|nr:S41 family peptidase [Acidobacteriota bacterium]